MSTGGPDKLKFEDFEDPKAGEGEVIVRVAAVSINPVDWKMRSGEAQARFPIDFPGILGRDRFRNDSLGWTRRDRL